MKPREIITEPLPLLSDLQPCEGLDTVLDDIKQKYGLTYDKYAELRNGLLEKHNGALPLEIFEKELLSSITIDFVASGLLEVQYSNENIKYIVSQRAKRAIKRHRLIGTFAKDKNDAEALIFLRNNGFLKRKV